MKTSGDQVITSVWAWTSGSHCYLILKYALEQMKRKITQSHIFCLKLHQHTLSTPLESCYKPLITSFNNVRLKEALVYILHIKVAPCQYQASPEIQICLQSAALIGCWVFNKTSAKLR